MKKNINEKLKEIFESFKIFFQGINKSVISTEQSNTENEELDAAFASAYNAGEKESSRTYYAGNNSQTKQSSTSPSRETIVRAPIQKIPNRNREDR